MIKNIIFDIGGVLFDDSDKNLEKALNKNEEEIKSISKVAFGGNFKKCLLGQLDIEDYINELKEKYPELSNELEYVLSPQNYNKTFQIMKDTFNLILELKQKGYKMYLLSNITEDSFKYINNVIDLTKYFDGGLYSYQEGMVKPNYNFYKKLLKKYNLSEKETIFFDDKDKNIQAAKDLGIKSVKFKSVNDIKNNL